ncbi:MAG: UDP-glucose 4-epimerase GalE [Proteobacteria bacterium]|nr:UDP-glucose 4-epimerase GalE [Pseudomonadota bacterium]MDA1324544.1 UDP-glucose 4-epimerase GalE [Pseudomonadota bacterium]
MDTVLVTGGAGFIGSHTCKALRGAGYLPVTFDDLSTGHARAVQWGPLIRGSLLDESALAAAMAAHAPVAVMHFAGVASVGESVEDPAKYYLHNVVGSVNLLRAMVTASVDAIVFSGSCSVYGDVDTETITEQTPLSPLSAYARSKGMVEQMLADFSSAYGLHTVSLRYFNAAGADADGEIGESHDPETHLVPLAIRAAIGHGPMLSIFGDDYPTPDGTCQRDYVHVTDLADAHVRALRRLLDGRLPPQLNLGAGQGVSVREVLKTVSHVCGQAVPSQTIARRPGDAARLVADITVARETLGWTPAHSALDEIIRTALAWEMKQGA